MFRSAKLFALPLLLAVAGIARADDITIGKLPYADVKITKVQDGKVTFVLPGGRSMEKNLTEVTWVYLSGNVAFNAAESLIKEGKQQEAIQAYAEALESELDAVRKDLIQSRMEGKTTPSTETPATPGGTPGGDSKVRCYYCNDTGLMQCPDCKGTGLARCPVCDGTGRLSVYDYKRYLLKKGKQLPRGGATPTEPIVCPECKGSGRAGPCPTCKGAKRVPCTHCKTDKTTRSPSKRPTEIESNDIAESKRFEQVSLFLSLDELAEAMRNKPANKPRDPREDKAIWGMLTTAQKKQAEEEYRIAQAAWEGKPAFRGERVLWILIFEDYSRASEGNEYIVKASSAKGNPVTARVAAAMRDTLFMMKRGDSIEIEGIIQDCAFATPESKAASQPAETPLKVTLSPAIVRFGSRTGPISSLGWFATRRRILASLP